MLMEEFYKFSKDMKYLALYWALGFKETDKEDIFIKRYSKSFHILIDANSQEVEMDGISFLNDAQFKLNTHKSFVVFECIDKLLTMGYQPYEIIVDLDNEYDIYVKNLMIKCFEWGHMDYEDNIKLRNPEVYGVKYSSRLTSGVIERETKITRISGQLDYGIFEGKRADIYKCYNKKDIKSNNPDFIIKGDKLVKYNGKDSIVVVPEGIKELGSSCFWDNQSIEKVVLPDSLINLGGDTFYNCFNLKEVNIPHNVRMMGNNPFAGCPLIKITNKSKNYRYINGALYTSNKERIIYYSISKKNASYKISSKTKVIGKHTFYMCNNLKLITLPKVLLKLENNPFSGCNELSINNKSSTYKIADKVIYDKNYNNIVGCLNSIKTNCLKLLPVKNICRNSFWNCGGIKEIILPETLVQIGYNPFVGCKDIKFISNSKKYKVVDGILMTADLKKLVCYPAWKAVGDIKVPDTIEILERGAFSGAENMTSIDFNNAKIISKTCFTNCNSLTKVVIPEDAKYIGEWAFAHCKSLKDVKVSASTEIDNNAFINSPCKVLIK